MALSTRARIAGIGGALAIGVLGAGGVAYAAGSGDAPAARYVTTVEDGTSGYSPEDCPEGSGGGTRGEGTTTPETTATPGDA